MTSTNSNISGNNQRKIHRAIREAVSTKLASLDGAAGERLLGNLDPLKTHVISGLDRLSAAPPPKPVVLKLVNASVQLDGITSYDPSGFKTRPGLWVSDDFHSRVGSKAKPVENLGAVTLTSGDLVKNAYDREITADPVMPANHVFESESEFVARLDQMISKQSEGEEGDLLNNGYANLFYVAGCVVRVLWGVVGQEWRVSTWKRDGANWPAGRRAFSSN